MKIYERKNEKIIILSDVGGNCPVLKHSGKSLSLKDDYGGKIESDLLSNVSNII
jgi:hypothetical protein